MITASYGIGKVLREPVSPFRVAQVFGAALNQPDASNWNGSPLLDNVASFDLSSLTPYHEVVVALVNLGYVDRALGITFTWYRARDNAFLYQSVGVIPAPDSGYYYPWYYGYSYIGYVPSEINENGAYYVDIAVTDLPTQRLNFTVSGIGVSTIPINVPMSVANKSTKNTAPAAVDLRCLLRVQAQGMPLVGDQTVHFGPSETKIVNFPVAVQNSWIGLLSGRRYLPVVGEVRTLNDAVVKTTPWQMVFF